ncbi:MAG: ABC transporter permease subunit [Alphaproteobacteria bacterium]|nr:ABC transporter permease subunit [Alphaproteobacteria bacterium]
MNDTTSTAVSPVPASAAPVRDEGLGEITRRTFWEANERHALGIGFIVFVLLLWEVIPHILTLSRGMDLFFTTPTQVAMTLYNMFASGEIWPAFKFSAVAFSVGLGLSIVAALPLGVIIGRSHTMNAMLDPFITAFNATPRLVFLPIILVWFGIGMWSVVVVVFIGAVFPLLINTYAGVRNADRLLINVVRSFGASEWQINKLVILPNSMPFIIAGLRLAIGRAILGIVVAEFFGGSSEGIGVMMNDAAGKFQVDIVFAGLVIFMALSLVMVGGVKVLEARLSRWRPENVKSF